MSQTMEQETSSIRDNEEEGKKHKSRRPPNTAFRQQRLKAWQPILTPKTVLPLFFAVGIIFAPIGGLLLWASSKVQEISIDYSQCNATAPACGANNETLPMPASAVTSYFKNTTDAGDAPRWCKDTTYVSYGGDTNVTTAVCRIQFYIPDRLNPPVLMYYQLTNFYQNHRRYVKSFDQSQLKGEYRSPNDIDGSDCDPLKLDADGKPYYPCGLIANSIFNDTIQAPVALNWPGQSNQQYTYNMSTENIAWGSDKDLYKTLSLETYPYGSVVPPVNWREKYPAYNETFPYPDLHTDEAFQVWMRTAGLPTFSKLARRNDDLAMEIGFYMVDIYDYFPVNLYDGTKSLLISTRTVMGGRNPFLGIAYVVVGGICIVLGALFTATHLIKPRKLGDHSYLSWNTDQPSTATTTGRAPRAGDSA